MLKGDGDPIIAQRKRKKERERGRRERGPLFGGGRGFLIFDHFLFQRECVGGRGR